MTDVETVPVKAEHLTEGMIVHPDTREVSDVSIQYNIWGPDDVRVEFFTAGVFTTAYYHVGQLVEVEC